MVKDQHLQLGCHHPLFWNFQQFNNKAYTAHHPIIQKEKNELLAKVPLNHQLEVLAFIQMYWWFLCTLVVYDPYSILSNLINICTFLFLRCPLSNKYDNIFGKVILLFPLILRMFFCIFLLSGTIIVIFVILLKE